MMISTVGSHAGADKAAEADALMAALQDVDIIDTWQRATVGWVSTQRWRTSALTSLLTIIKLINPYN